MNTRKHPSVRSLLMTTTPDAPYAVEPTRAELLAALRRAADHDLTAAEADALLSREDRYRAWIARRDALQLAVVGHYKSAGGTHQAIACRCPSCEKWRAETQRLYTSKRAIDGPVN